MSSKAEGERLRLMRSVVQVDSHKFALIRG